MIATARPGPFETFENLATDQPERLPNEILMRRFLPMLLACASLLVAPAAAQETPWVAPSGAYGLNYEGADWVTVPNRSAADQTVLRLAPRNFDPTAPRLCSARHYQLNPGPGWETAFPQWSRETADQVSVQNAAQMLSLPGGRVYRVEHSDVGDTRVADVHIVGVPLGGLNFNIRYRVFAVRGVNGPIMVQLDCRTSEALGPDVFEGLDSILNSLRIPG